MEGVEEHCRRTLAVSFWVEFPLKAACIAFAAGNLIRQNTAGAGWVFLPLPSMFEATKSLVLPCAGACDTTGLGRGNSRAFGSRRGWRRAFLPLICHHHREQVVLLVLETQGIPRGGTVLLCPWGVCSLLSTCPPVLQLIPSPRLPFPSFSFMGCLAPSTFRCQSVLAHCYSPPISLAQPSFKLLCQGARIPWWR